MKSKLLQWIFEKVWGWSITGTFPFDVSKALIIVAPHTSNWDFPVGILIRNGYGVKIDYMAKASLFKFPFGWLMRGLGGHPIDRSKNNNVVDAVTDLFNSKESLYLNIAPEGTRSKVEKPKTGYYYIAKQAKVPIIYTTFDWEHMIVHFAEPREALETADDEVAYFMEYFRGVKGRNPKNGIM